MSPFYRTSALWVVDFTYDGAPRQWIKALPQGADARIEMERLLADLYSGRAQLSGVRPATDEEETRYIRGDLPRNAFCPTLR